MASQIEGYSCDVFISYRQNDNKSGWVSGFVKALQEELAQLMKEPVSVYFDTDPKEGLRETHVVGKSIERRLRTLVFVPVLSQTYCDQEGFAWKQEFSEFFRLAAKDLYGLDIDLRSGNVGSRILPVKIHDLEPRDEKLWEEWMGSPPRAIDFVHRSPGVNRPLRPGDGSGDTARYEDQVNRVAIAIKEVIMAMRDRDLQDGESQREKATSTAPTKRNLVVAAAVILVVVAFLGIRKPWSQAEVTDKSVAVLPFADMSPGRDQEWFSDGLTDEILNSLMNLRQLKVTARTSSFYFKGKNVPIPEIAEKLGVSTVLEGTVKTMGDRMRISAQLIRSDGFQIWSKNYERETKDLFKVQTEIAEAIAGTLLMELSPEQKILLAGEGSVEPRARQFFQRANYDHDRYRTSLRKEDFDAAEKEFFQSVSIEPGYAEAYAELSNLYDTWGIYNSGERWDQRDSVLAIASRIAPRSPAVLKMKANASGRSGNIDSAISYLSEAFHARPNDPDILNLLGSIYSFIGAFERGQKFHDRAMQLDPLSPGPYVRSANVCFWGRFDTVRYKMFVNKGLELNPTNPTLLTMRLQCCRPWNLQDFLYEREYRVKNNMPVSMILNGAILAMEGKREGALGAYKRTTRQISDFHLYYLLNDKEGMLASLDSVMTNDYVDPIFLLRPWEHDFLKDDPRYHDLARRGSEKREKYMARYGKLKWEGID